MAGRKFPLLDGNMNDLVWAAAIACGVDVGRARLLPPIGNYSPVRLALHPRIAKREPERVGFAAQRVQEVVCLSFVDPTAFRECHCCTAWTGPYSQNLGA